MAIDDEIVEAPTTPEIVISPVGVVATKKQANKPTKHGLKQGQVVEEKDYFAIIAKARLAK